MFLLVVKRDSGDVYKGYAQQTIVQMLEKNGTAICYLMIDSTDPDVFSQFELLHDDYTPKPAFERYRQLIAELGTQA